MLRASDDKDPYLRHAGVMGLAGAGKQAAWKDAIHDRSPAARMAILLALRRLEDPEVAQFLNDPDPRLVLEAARAINDLPITGAVAALAAVRLESSAPLPLLRRVLNANFRLGGSEHAAALAAAASRQDLPDAARALALDMLAKWAKPPGLDMVMGLWRPLPERSAEPAAAALGPNVVKLLTSGPAAVRGAAVLAAAALRLKEAGEPLALLAVDREQPDRIRAEAIKALDLLEDPRRIAATHRALVLPGAKSRTEALRVLAKLDPAAAIAPLEDRIAHGSTAERQGAVMVLAAMPGDEPRKALLGWLNRLIAGQVPAEIQLDLIEAAAKRPEAEFRGKLKDYESSKPRGDVMAPYREVLTGGDSQRGMTIFMTRTDLECVRCHKVKGATAEPAGGDVGPELSDVGARQTPAYLLESIVDPNKQIAQGFESIVVATTDGKVETGILRGEDEREVRLMTALGKPITLEKATIEERKRGPSAMPADLAKKLSKMELRDLVAFLASLKSAPSIPRARRRSDAAQFRCQNSPGITVSGPAGWA